VIHGERNTSEEFAKLVRERFGFEASVPGLGDVIPLAALAPKAAAPPAVEMVWPDQLSRFAGKLEAIKTLWGQTPDTIPAGLLQKLAERLEPIGAELDQFLQESQESSGVR
jgi:hypothetical protein